MREWGRGERVGRRMEVHNALAEGEGDRWWRERKGGRGGPWTMAVATSCLAVPDGDMKAGSGPMCEVVGVGTMASVSSITTPSTFSMSATFIVLHARRDTVKGSRPRMVDEKRVWLATLGNMNHQKIWNRINYLTTQRDRE